MVRALLVVSQLIKTVLDLFFLACLHLVLLRDFIAVCSGARVSGTLLRAARALKV